MEFDVTRHIFVEGSEQMTAQCRSIRATQSMPSPDFTDRVPALIATLNQFSQPLAQLRLVAQGLFQRTRSLDGKLFVEECE